MGKILTGDLLCALLGLDLSADAVVVDLSGLVNAALVQMKVHLSGEQAEFALEKLEMLAERFDGLEGSEEIVTLSRASINALAKRVPPDRSKMMRLERILHQLKEDNATLAKTVAELQESLNMAAEDEAGKLSRLRSHVSTSHRGGVAGRLSPSSSTPRRRIDASGRLSSPGATWSSTVALQCVKSSAAGSLDSAAQERAAEALGLSFIALQGDLRAALPKSRLRKFLVSVGSRARLAEADLAISKVNGAKGRVGFEAYCDIVVGGAVVSGKANVLESLTERVRIIERGRSEATKRTVLTS